MMEQMGLDFAILNLHVDASGVNRLELAAIRNIFGVAASVDTSVRFAVQLCPYDCGPERLKHVLDVIGKDHACRDHYLRMGGRPVLFVFWTAAMDGREDLVSAIRQHASNFIRIGAMLTPSGGGRESRKAGRIFHGRALFSPLDVSVPAEWERVWRTAYEQSDAGDENIRVITVSPGYDDSHLKDPRRKHNPLRRVDRLDGQTYQRMIDFALSSVPAPHMIIVSTFNEYHENTHIEPSLKHGRRYFEMTRALVRAGKEEWRTD